MDINKVSLAPVLKILKSANANKLEEKGVQHRQASATERVRQNSRNPDQLKEQLRVRLLRLKQESSDFAIDAPRVVIQEIMVWEFGDKVLEHPDFKSSLSLLLKTLLGRDDLNLHMQKMVSDLIS